MWGNYEAPKSANEAKERVQEERKGNFKEGIFASGTVVLASLSELKWKQFDTGEELIEGRWVVLEPESGAGIRINHKFRVLGNEGQRNRALDQLFALGAYAKTSVIADAYKAKATVTDAMLAELVDVVAALGLETWAFPAENGKEASGGNWVSRVLDPASTISENPVYVDIFGNTIAAGAPTKPQPESASFDDGDIPF